MMAQSAIDIALLYVIQDKAAGCRCSKKTVYGDYRKTATR